MPTILVIDDNRAVSTALEVLFSLHDIDTLHAESPAAGLALLREQPVGREKLFIHPKLMQLLTQDGNTFSPYAADAIQ